MQIYKVSIKKLVLMNTANFLSLMHENGGYLFYSYQIRWFRFQCLYKSNNEIIQIEERLKLIEMDNYFWVNALLNVSFYLFEFKRIQIFISNSFDISESSINDLYKHFCMNQIYIFLLMHWDLIDKLQMKQMPYNVHVISSCSTYSSF
jgi:hypothetical protein